MIKAVLLPKLLINNNKASGLEMKIQWWDVTA